MANAISEIPIAVFAYNFPHRKTQDFLFALKVLGADVRIVLLADPVKLRIPPSSVRTKIRHIGLIHPRDVVSAIGFSYRITEHNSKEVPSLIRESGAMLGVIAGARILKPHVINSFPLGIVNFHPGLIPEARGLDAVLWSILEMVPLGVTAHLIDEQVDAGKILSKKKIPLYCDDTIVDFTERVYETQITMLESALMLAARGEGRHLQDAGKYHGKMPPALEKKALSAIPNYLAKFAGCEEAHAQKKDSNIRS